MAKKRDAAAEVEKQINRVSNAVEDYRKGVRDVTEHPGKKAAKKKDKMRANVLAAIDSGKWEENVGGYDLGEWQENAAGTGADRLVQGLEKSRAKQIDFRQQLITFQESVKARIDAMPDATPEQREAKMLANMREMRKFKRSPRRR